MFKVVYISYNSIDKRYPNNLSDGNSFYTYGWQSLSARKFKKYNPDVTVESWKADPRIDKIYEKEIDNVKHIVFPSKDVWKLGQYSSQLIKYLKKHLEREPNTIFNIGTIRHLLFYSVTIHLKNYPLAVQNYGETSAIYKAKINKGLKKLFYSFQIPVEWYSFKFIDLFFVLDKKISKYLPKSNKQIKIRTYRIGINHELFNPIDKKEAQKLLKLSADKKYILYVGRLNYTKRPDILIDIYEEFKKEGRNDIELILAGHEKSDPLYEKAKKSGAILYGKILQNELYKYLSAANVYVLPLLFEEIPFGGIGLLSVEALLCNTPITGSTVASFPSSDVDKVGIVSVNHKEIKEAILKIINEEIVFGNIKEIALKYYSWENISAEFRENYTEIMDKYNTLGITK